MSVPSQQATFRPEDLLRLPDGKSFELVNGQLVEKNIGFKSSWIGGRVACLLKNHCEATALDWVAGAGYKCFTFDPSHVRKPTGSFEAIA